MTFRLRFRTSKIRTWSDRYSYQNSEAKIENKIAPAVKGRGWLRKPEFLEICRWKTPRTQKLCATNSADFIKIATETAFASKHERLRIEVLTLLDGVSWPTASVFLHFCHSDCYPILDYRALWSCGAEVPTKYTFAFWNDYTLYCRETARKADVGMRTLDRAMWQFSKENQV